MMSYGNETSGDYMPRPLAAFVIILLVFWGVHSSLVHSAQIVPDSARTSSLAAIASVRDTSLSHKTAVKDSTSWFEKHPALTGLFGAIIGALVALLGLQTIKKARKFAKAAKQGELEAAHEREKEIQIQAQDEIERRYLNGVKNEHDSLKLYGFQSRVNLDVRTLEVFVSLRLMPEERADEMRAWAERDDGRALSPEEVLQRAARKKRLLLIVGDPGSGKTTLLKYYAISCLEEPERKRLGLPQPLIPILLPLRKVDPKLPFCEALSAWATRRNRPVTATLFDQWLEKRGALVMLDGLDEISDLGKRQQVCEWIDNAADYYGRSQFVVTSRYTGYRVSEGIALHADHLRADVLDLDPGQQEAFLKNWFAAIYGRESEDADLTAEARQREAAAQAQDLADAIGKYLTRPENESLHRMAGTPMLLQIMALLWKEYHNLPPARAALYEKCLDYLLDYRDRDREKEIIPLLPADDAKIVLRPLCLWLQEIRKSDEVTAKEIAAQIAGLLEEVKPGSKPAEFVKNLCVRAGILQELGEGSYMFRHKSFREYLAATHLAEEVKRDPARATVLVENFHEGWWRETILFALSLPKPVIFADFFTRFLPHAGNAPNALPLLELAIKEARQKSIEPFAAFVLDPLQDWQKRYNTLQCLRLIASEPAKDLMQRVWDLEKHREHQNHEGRRLLQKAEEILIEWKLRRPEPLPAPAHGTKVRAHVAQSEYLPAFELAQIQSPSWRNPFELDSEYILILGGKYEFSVTNAETVVPDLYFAKFPLTNKLYRRFVDYLADQNTEEIFKKLPVEQFAQNLLTKATKLEGLADYLGKNPRAWHVKLRSRHNDEKRFNSDDQPVVGVSWYAAMAYCQWLTEMQKANSWEQRAEGIAQSGHAQEVYRLPTEAEWEWAASGGKREYPWGNEKPDERHANYGGRVGHTTAVGAYPAGATPEPEGLMDMAGNVWEWMENRYDNNKAARALRGGSWNDDADDLRCAARGSWGPDSWNYVIGFRVVRAQSVFDTLKL